MFFIWPVLGDSIQPTSPLASVDTATLQTLSGPILTDHPVIVSVLAVGLFSPLPSQILDVGFGLDVKGVAAGFVLADNVIQDQPLWDGPPHEAIQHVVECSLRPLPPHAWIPARAMSFAPGPTAVWTFGDELGNAKGNSGPEML